MQINSTMPMIVGMMGKPKKSSRIRSTLNRVFTQGSFQYSRPINRMISLRDEQDGQGQGSTDKNSVMIFHCSLRMDFVPDAPYRLNELITQLLLELVPQVADVHHNRIIGDVIFLLPDLLENILGAKDSPRLAGKQIQNFEFSCRQRDRFAIGRYFMCCPVNVEPVDLDPVAVLPKQFGIVQGGAPQRVF